MIAERIKTVIEELEAIRAEAETYDSNMLLGDLTDALTPLYWAYRYSSEADI